MAHVCLHPRKRVHHSPFGKRSHTRAHTAKQGHSLPRPQCGFVLPAKSLLFHRAFIYIHFPVLYEPSTPAEEKNPAKLPPQRCSKPLFIAFFNFSHKRPMLAFTAESGYTLAFANRIAHSGLHGETGVFGMGALLLPSERFARFGNPAWPGGRTRPRWAARLSYFCLNCGLYALRSGPFRVCETRGGITTFGVLCVLLKRRTAACQNGSFAIFRGQVVIIDSSGAKCA